VGCPPERASWDISLAKRPSVTYAATYLGRSRHARVGEATPVPPVHG
jgi:hypothetical protein